MKPFRFPGVASYDDSDLSARLFFGREEEGTKLLHYILSEHLIILFSKSGYGKTSILKAYVFRKLREKGFYPFLVRFNQKEFSPQKMILARLHDISNDPHVEVVPSSNTENAKAVLSNLEIWSTEDKLLTPVMILDQFEEIFTLEHNLKHRNDFFHELAQLISAIKESGLRIKIVISIREDFLAHLEKLSIKIPSIFTNRFRLEPLKKENAEEVITEPAHIEVEGVEFASPPFYFAQDAKNELLQFLSLKIVEGNYVQSDEIEPIQLQIICSEVEERVIANKILKENNNIVIHAKDLGGEQGMKQILGSFYDKQLLKLKEMGLKAPDIKAIRNVIERELIIGKRRVPLDYYALINKPEINKEAIDMLITNKLLDLESHQGNPLVEISHDTLVEPILTLFEKRKIEEERAAALRKTKVFVTFAVITLVILAAGFLSFVHYSNQKLASEEKKSMQEKYYYSAISSRRNNPTFSYELAREGLNIDTTNKKLIDLVQEYDNDTNYAFVLSSFRVPKEVTFAQLDEGNSEILIEDQEDTYVWDAKGFLKLKFHNKFQPHNGMGDTLSFVSKNGKYKVSSIPGMIKIQDAQGKVLKEFIDYASDEESETNQEISLDISDDFKYLVAGSKDTKVRIWDLQDMNSGSSSPKYVLSRLTYPVIALKLSPDNHYVLAGGTDGTTVLWDLNSLQITEGKHSCVLKGHRGKISFLNFTGNDYNKMITGFEDGFVLVWGRDSIRQYYNRRELARFSPFEYYQLGLNDYKYDTSGIENLVVTTLNYNASIPKVNTYPEDKTYQNSLDRSFKELLALYDTIVSHRHFTDITKPNLAYLFQNRGELLNRKSNLLSHAEHESDSARYKRSLEDADQWTRRYFLIDTSEKDQVLSVVNRYYFLAFNYFLDSLPQFSMASYARNGSNLLEAFMVKDTSDSILKKYYISMNLYLAVFSLYDSDTARAEEAMTRALDLKNTDKNLTFSGEPFYPKLLSYLNDIENRMHAHADFKNLREQIDKIYNYPSKTNLVSQR